MCGLLPRNLAAGAGHHLYVCLGFCRTDTRSILAFFPFSFIHLCSFPFLYFLLLLVSFLSSVFHLCLSPFQLYCPLSSRYPVLSLPLASASVLDLRICRLSCYSKWIRRGSVTDRRAIHQREVTGYMSGGQPLEPFFPGYTQSTRGGTPEHSFSSPFFQVCNRLVYWHSNRSQFPNWLFATRRVEKTRQSRRGRS